MEKARAKYLQTLQGPEGDWSWRHGQEGPERSFVGTIFAIRTGSLDCSRLHDFGRGSVSHSSAREAAKGFLIDMDGRVGARRVGRDPCAGLSTSLLVRIETTACQAPHLPLLKRKQSRYSSPSEIMCTSAHSCLPPFGGLFAWARALLADRGARCQCVSIRGDETLCAKKAAIPRRSLAPSSQAGGQWGSPSQREGSASGLLPSAMEAAQFQWELWARGVPGEVLKGGEDRTSLAAGSSPLVIFCSLVSDHVVLLVCLTTSIPWWKTALCHHVVWHVTPCTRLQLFLYHNRV